MAAITPMYDSRPKKLKSAFGKPAHDNAPSRRKKLKMRLFTGTVIAKTTITATPRPKAVEIFFDIAMNVHIPKKKVSAMFSINTARTKMPK
jgi:hypothetical protein